MILQTFPTEVVERIIELFDSRPSSAAASSSDLLSLASTCRALYTMTRPFIFRDIWLIYPSNTFELLARTIQEHPTYGEWTRKVTLQVIFDTPTESRNADLISLKGVMKQLSNLEKIRVLSLSPRRILSMTNTDKLRKILSVCTYHNTTNLEMRELISQPALRALIIHPRCYSFVTPSHQAAPHATNKTLRHLEAGMLGMHTECLKDILSNCHTLEYLQIPVPMHRQNQSLHMKVLCHLGEFQLRSPWWLQHSPVWLSVNTQFLRVYFFFGV